MWRGKINKAIIIMMILIKKRYNREQKVSWSYEFLHYFRILDKIERLIKTLLLAVFLCLLLKRNKIKINDLFERLI